MCSTGFFVFYPSSGFPDWCIFRHGGPCSAEKWKCSVFKRRGSLRAASVWCLPEGLVTLFQLSFSPNVNPLPLHSWLLANSGLVVTMLLFFSLCVCSTGVDCIYVVLTSDWTFPVPNKPSRFRGRKATKKKIGLSSLHISGIDQWRKWFLCCDNVVCCGLSVVVFCVLVNKSCLY